MRVSVSEPESIPEKDIDTYRYDPNFSIRQLGALHRLAQFRAMSARGRRKRSADALAEQEAYFHADKNDLSARIGGILGSEKFSDVMLLVGAERARIPAHRLVLGLASPFFRVLLLEGNGWRESESREVALPDDTPAILRKCLEWMYKGALNLTASDALLVLEAARRYELEGLQSGCRDAALHFCKEAGPTSLFHVFTSAVDMGDEPLKQSILLLLGPHTRTLLSNDELLRTARAEYLRELVESDDLQIRESELYHRVLAWSEFDKPSRAPELPSILQNIRLVLMKPSELHSTIRASRHFSDERILDALAHKEEAKTRRWLLVPSLREYQTIELSAGSRVTIGRSSTSLSIRPDVPIHGYSKISKRHCTVKVTPASQTKRMRVVVTDHSTHGTYIEGASAWPCQTLYLDQTLSFCAKTGQRDAIVPTYTLQRAPIEDKRRRPRHCSPEDERYAEDTYEDEDLIESDEDEEEDSDDN